MPLTTQIKKNYKVPSPSIDRRNGANNTNAKLQIHQVCDIFISPHKLEYLAVLYNVSVQTIYKIKRGKTWGHVTRYLVEERYSARSYK